MATRITLRGDTKANWESVNPILSAKEMVIETDTNRTKIGNGTSTFTELKYVDTRPYKKWVGIISYSGTFSITVLENNLGDISWTNPFDGRIHANSVGLFTTNKCFTIIGGIKGWTSSVSFGNNNTIVIFLQKDDGTQDTTPYFSEMPVEIRVYE